MKIYRKMHSNEVIDEDEAFDYVMEQLFKDEEKGLMDDFKENFGEDLVNWFFSGNFIEEEWPLERIINGRW